MRYLYFIYLILAVSFSGLAQDNASAAKSDSTTSGILGLRTAAYQVGDINAAKEWYSKAFAIQPYFDEPFYVGFNVRGFELGLQPAENPATEKPASVLTYWGVEDIQATYDHFLACGATSHEAPTNVGGDLVVASVKDPWDNIIGLIYNPDFKLENE